MTVHDQHKSAYQRPLDTVKPQVIGYNGCRLGLAAEKQVVPLACLHLHWDMTTRDGGTMAHEEWRDVVGYEGLYQVSDQGRVKSLDRLVTNRNGITQHRKGQFLRPSVTKKGEYPTVTLCDSEGQKCFVVHVLMANAFMGERDEHAVISHINGVKHDNRLSNLRLATFSEVASNRQKNQGVSKSYVPTNPDGQQNFDYEQWRSVVGYEGLYEVSNLGRVRGVDRVLVNKDGVSRKFSGKILKTHLTKMGYPHVCLCKDGVISDKLIHRLVAEAFLLPDESRTIVDHINGIKTDNRVENLRWATKKENYGYALHEQGLIDAEKLSRISSETAKRSGLGKIRCKPVVRSDGKTYKSAAEAARELGVNASQVSSTARGVHKSCKGFSFWYLDEPEKLEV